MQKGKQERKNTQKEQTSSTKTAIIVLVLIAVAFFAVKSLDDTPTPNGRSPAEAVQDDDTQIIRMAVERSAYIPSALTVKEGPVRWVIDGTNAVGCTQYLIAQELGISKKLEKGENLITFTPPRKGIFRFSCGMGMVDGTINVM